MKLYKLKFPSFYWKYSQKFNVAYCVRGVLTPPCGVPFRL